MKLSKMLAMVALVAAISFSSCKPKDADIQKSLQGKEAAGIMVEVKDGVATLNGIAADDAAKATAEKIAKDEKDISAVVNNITVALPVVITPPASTVTVLDAATQQIVKDGLKDIKGVTVEFNADKAMLSGEVSKADRMKIMQMLAAAKVKSDVSKLVDKK